MSTRDGETTPPDRDAAPPERPAPAPAAADAAPPPPAEPPETAGHRRPTAWIVLSGVLALAVVGLAIWALSAKSDADDAEAALKAQSRAPAAATATPTPAPEPEPEPAEVDPATQQEFEQVKGDLGATTESLDEIEQDLDQATAKVDEADQAKDNASGALDGLKADVEAATARFELLRTCLRGTLDAVGAAFEGGGLEAAVQELQKLSGNCRSVSSS